MSVTRNTASYDENVTTIMGTDTDIQPEIAKTIDPASSLYKLFSFQKSFRNLTQNLRIKHCILLRNLSFSFLSKGINFDLILLIKHRHRM